MSRLYDPCGHRDGEIAKVQDRIAKSAEQNDMVKTDLCLGLGGLSIKVIRLMAINPAYAVRKADLLRAADDLEQLSVELRKEKARLDWLLPRQHTHQTRESIDREL